MRKYAKKMLLTVLVQILVIGMCKIIMAVVPGDAVEYNSNSYKVYNLSQTWTQAKASCEKEGGHLVTITSSGENSFVLNLMKKSGTKNSYWIGAKMDSSDTMKWVTGEAFSFSNWNRWEPDNYQGTQGHAFMIRVSPNADWFEGAWGDIEVDGNSWDNGPFFGTGNFGFVCEWEQLDISKATLTLSKDLYTYDGTEKKPAVTVSLNGRTLAKDTNYTIAYSNNIQPGTAKVTITGVGKYTGTVTRTYTIDTAKDLSKASVTLSQSVYTYDGTAKEPSVTVTIDGKTLTKDTDYSVSYSGSNQIGIATAYVRGIGNNYGEISKTYQIKLATPKISSLKSTKPGQATAISSIVNGADGYRFTFKAVSKTKKNIVVPSTARKATSTKVVPGAKYSVTVKAKVTRDGKTYYSDASAAKTITIKNNNDLSKAAVKLAKTSYKYDGKAKKPAVTVTINGKKLKKGTDYTVTYKNNKKPGLATVTVKGKKNYKGSKKVYFEISSTITIATQGEKKVYKSGTNGKTIKQKDIKEEVKKKYEDAEKRFYEKGKLIADDIEKTFDKIEEDKSNTVVKEINTILAVQSFNASKAMPEKAKEELSKALLQKMMGFMEVSPSIYKNCKTEADYVNATFNQIKAGKEPFQFTYNNVVYTMTLNLLPTIGGAAVVTAPNIQDSRGGSHALSFSLESKTDIKTEMDALKTLADSKIKEAKQAAVDDAKELLMVDEFSKLLKNAGKSKVMKLLNQNDPGLAQKIKKAQTMVKEYNNLKNSYKGVKDTKLDGLKAEKVVDKVSKYNKKVEAFINAVNNIIL